MTPTRMTWRYLAGLVVVLVAALLLSWPARTTGLLPFRFGIVGLYFLVLIGLVMGALLFRCGLPDQPWSRSMVIGSAVLVAVVMGGATWLQEWRAFVDETAERALRVNKRKPADHMDQYTKVQESIEGTWREHYGVGGPVGYAKWTMAGGPMFRVAPEGGRALTVQHRQAGKKWLIRGLLSFAAFGWAIVMQVLPLARKPEAPGETESSNALSDQGDSDTPNDKNTKESD